MGGIIPRLLLVGDGPVATGFARVIQAILRPLQSQFDIHQIAISYVGDPHDYTWKLYPAIAGGDKFGVNRVQPLLKALKPDLVFIVNTIPLVREIIREIKKTGITVPIIAYCPIEGEPLIPQALEGLDEIHSLVLYTDYAYSVYKTAYWQLKGRDCSNVHIIPHGVDMSIFKPLLGESKKEARYLLFGKESTLNDSFIVLNANRNQPRKRIDATIEGFAQFACDKPENVKLYLHMGVEDLGWNIFEMVRRFGIADRLILTHNSNAIPGVSDEHLNIIYNACDLGINTSMSEGWGLVSFEHAATGTAQLIPHHTGCTESWEGYAELLEPSFTMTEAKSLTRQFLISAEEVACKLNLLYHDRNRLALLAESAIHRVSHPKYRWELISAQWKDLFFSAIAGI